jgi:cobalt-zinc-cadmium efflux system protein
MIEGVPGVKNVHDLHIWAVEPSLIMLTCHVLVDGNDEVLTNALLHSIRARVSSGFGIHHMTIQMETSCCHPDAVHCDLNKLAVQHREMEAVHPHL